MTDSISGEPSRLRTLLLSRYGSLYLIAALYLVRCLAVRVALAVRSESMLDLDLPKALEVFVVGAAFDLVACAWILLPAALLLSVLPRRWFGTRLFRTGAVLAVAAATGAFLFEGVAEWLFWDEFQARFNFIAVDYLIYTTEVVDNIVESYSLPLILIGIAAGVLAVLAALRGAVRTAIWTPRGNMRRALPLLVLLAIPAVGWGLVHERGAEVSDNRFVNELVKNGESSFVAAFFGNVLDFEENYETLPTETAFRRVRAEQEGSESGFLSTDTHDLTRSTRGRSGAERWNVLLVTIESLSAEFVGALGDDRGLTPHMDALAEDSLLFTNVFATGTRTVRGLEALSLSIPPTPGRSILRRPGNDRMVSLGQVFRENGYDTKFAYGGYGYFDGMNSFFESNGYEVVDRSDITPEETTFSNAWGVCDEDLYGEVLRECDESVDAGRPFFVHVMTTSNHRPYTYPDVVDIPPGNGRYGAVQYSDHAIGKLMEAARTKPWYDRTIFVFVADHCASSAGKRSVELAKHHIPLLIHAPGLFEPARVDELGSQVDVAPTLFALLDLDVRMPFYGNDLLRSGPRRAFVGNYQCLGLYEGDQLAVLLPRRLHACYRVGADRTLSESADSPHLLTNAISFYESACALYSAATEEP